MAIMYHQVHLARTFTLLLALLAINGCGGARLSSKDEMRQIAENRAKWNRQQKAQDDAPDAAQKSDKKGPLDLAAEKAEKAPKNDSKNSQKDPRKADQPSEPPPKLVRAPVPEQPLTRIERRQRTIDNLTRIGKAIKNYVKDNRRMFCSATWNQFEKRPYLSWRVELLPYLGYEDLYKQFRQEEPWDSDHNSALLEYIPAEYQSPERFDTATNYVVPYGTSTAFPPFRARLLVRIEDSVEYTVAMVEADDEVAVPWTKPAELDVDLSDPLKNLGNLRKDGFFVVWCDGTVSRVDRHAKPADVKAIITCDAGDRFTYALVRAEPNAEPLAEVDPTTQVAQDNSDATSPDEKMTDDDPTNPNRPGGAATDPQAKPLIPVPEPHEIEKARALAIELYQAKYKACRTDSQRQALATQILREAENVTTDPASQYVLLEIAMNIAVQAGDSGTAIQAVNKLTAQFDVDPLALKDTVFSALVKQGDERAGHAQLLDEAKEMIELAMHRDEFDTAEKYCKIAITAAGKLDDRRAVILLHAEKRRIQEARTAYAKVRRALTQVGKSDDPVINLSAGRYFCLVKGDWNSGLPLLANCGDPQLEEIARLELRHPSVPEEQVALADLWWKLADSTSSDNKMLWLRAALWYRRAAGKLPEGLLKIKSQMRAEQVTKTYGKAELDRM